MGRREGSVMPLVWLIALVVGGIAGIALLTHVLGLSRPRRFASDAEAEVAWLREYPHDAARRIVRCRDGRAALVICADGVGLVWPMGADSTARRLAGARVGERGDRLVIRLPDFTAPRVTLRLDAAERAIWLRHIAGGSGG